MPISEMKKVIEGKNREQQVALVLAMHGAAILRGSRGSSGKRSQCG